jgi:UDP-N-acetylmuramoylalanine--D-glutamate ligase
MRLADLRGQRVLVLGVGIDVAAALDVLVGAGPAELTVVDQAPERAAAALDAAGHGGLAVVGDVDHAPDATIAVRSPGFSPYQAAVASRIAAGLRTTTPLGLWLVERGDRPTVAITGTKGKSSTSVLTADALARLGRPAVVLGNFGTPPWAEDPASERTAVVEVSSYVATDLPVTAPVAALTATGEDHIGWHGSVERYLADKARVFTAPLPVPGPRWCGVPAGVELPPPFDSVGFTRVDVDHSDLRASNATVAAAAALAATDRWPGGTPPADVPLADLVADLLAAYPDLPGRFSTVATVGPVAFVDDALASNPLGLAAGLRSLSGQPVAVIVGGADRGASFEPVLSAIAARQEPTTVVGIDDAPGGTADACRRAGAAVSTAVDLEAAVEVATAAVAAGGTVLFSPGMPTPPDQGSWADRSRRFRDAVERQRAGGTG